MKLITITTSFLLLIICTCRLSAQTFETAVQYMEFISTANQALTEKYLVYLSGMSHGKSARKVEKRRQEVLAAIIDTRYKIVTMPPFKGDRTFRDTTVAYLKMMNSVFNEDYGKILNMEEIAEQSYDAMEAYMLAQEKANEKLQQASAKQFEQQKKFAAKHNVTLIESESDTEAKMKLANSVMKHYDEVYLIFFKPYKQEAYLMEAVNQKKINSIEQNINSLENFATQGIEKLGELNGYNNDPSLINTCRNMLNFYKEEAKKGSVMTDLFLKEENFNKIKKQFDATPSSKRTQKDVDQYNNMVNEMNAASTAYNAVNNELNKQRAKSLNEWNNAVKKYMDNYMPTQQR